MSVASFSARYGGVMEFVWNLCMALYNYGNWYTVIWNQGEIKIVYAITRGIIRATEGY